MKVPNKKILSLLLACLMAFNLTACGSSNADTNAGEAPSARDTTKTNTSAQAENTSVEVKPYQSEFIHIMSDSKTSLTPLAFTKEGIYAMGEDVLGRRAPDDVADTYFGQYDIREPRIFYVSYTGETTKLPGYTPAPVPAVPENVYNLTTSTHIMGLAINSNGNLITFESSYANWTDIQIVDTDDPDYYTHYFYDTDYYIRELQPDGGEISCTVVECGGNDFLYSSCTTDQDGNILVRRETGLGEYALLGVSPKGEIIYEIESQDTISTTFTMEDGSLYASIWGYEMLMVPIDIENKTLGEGTTLPSNAYSVFSGGGDYPLYYTSGVWFYGFDPKTGASDKLFSWLDLDITPEYLTAIGVSEDGTIRTITSDFYNDTASYSVDIACIRKNTDTAPAEKSELTLATLNLSFDLRNAVIRFNRHSDKVHITVKDYSEYNTEDDFTAGMMKLTTEIIAGNSPDIIDLNGVSRAQFESKGFLEDLAPYLDADASISREDFLPNVLAAAESDGKLYSTFSSFTLGTVVGAAAITGEEPGWTYNDLSNALLDMPEGCDAFDITTTRDEVLRTCLNLDMNDFVNWSTGEVDFANDEFTSLIEFAGQFPESYDWETYDAQADDAIVRITEGQQMLYRTNISSFDDLMYIDACYSGTPITFIGYPTLNGTGNTISLDYGFAMSSACKDKESAWEFLREFFTPGYYLNYVYFGLPVQKSLYEKKLAEIVKVTYEVDNEGNYLLDAAGKKVPTEHYYSVNNSVYTYFALSEDLAAQFRALVDSTTKVAVYDDSITAIVLELTAPYYAGEKSAAETAQLVQSRAMIYVNEQR